MRRHSRPGLHRSGLASDYSSQYVNTFNVQSSTPPLFVLFTSHIGQRLFTIPTRRPGPLSLACYPILTASMAPPSMSHAPTSTPISELAARALPANQRSGALFSRPSYVSPPRWLSSPSPVPPAVMITPAHPNTVRPAASAPPPPKVDHRETSWQGRARTVPAGRTDGMTRGGEEGVWAGRRAGAWGLVGAGRAGCVRGEGGGGWGLASWRLARPARVRSDNLSPRMPADISSPTPNSILARSVSLVKQSPARRPPAATVLHRPASHDKHSP